MSLARLLYRTAWWLALPVVFARFAWRARREPEYAQAWPQRLGLRLAPWPKAAPADPSAPAASPNTIQAAGAPAARLWLHAVSLGETRAAQPLVEALRQALPGLQLLLTTSTATGWQAGAALLRPGDVHTWAPLDTAGAPRRMLLHYRPQLLLLMETETWPELVDAAAQAQVPVVLANARLSERSLRKALRSPGLVQPMLRRLSAVWSQTEADAQRLVQAGVPQSAVQVMGNLKYDRRVEPSDRALGAAWRSAWGRPVVMAASWREGEDEALLGAWKAALGSAASATAASASAPDAIPIPTPTPGASPGSDPASVSPLLLLVPRHPQRFDEVAQAVQGAGLRLQRRSQWDGGAVEADVLLGDSVGEMARYFSAADVALLGGSYAPLGGQNLIEAAACGCPIVMGPHTFNFAQASEDALASQAAWRCRDLSQAVPWAWQLVSGAEADTLAHARSQAQAFAAAHTGATLRTVQALRQRWPQLPWAAEGTPD